MTATSDRSSGDGMESLKVDEEIGTNVNVLRSAVYTHNNGNSQNKVNTIPSIAKASIQLPVHAKLHSKLKEPKFVPYEPYKAAVTPMVIVANNAIDKSVHQCKSIKNICGKRQGTSSKKTLIIDELQLKPCKCVVENQKLEEELAKVKEENKSLENQLNIQIQVNKELKHLLVASVGEDMEAKVHFLTEDKTKLAHDILTYSEKLMEETEAIEKLSIQCDVWRSKYLASGLIVDELAGWKAVLGHHLNDAIETIKLLLQENETYRKRCRAMSYMKSLNEEKKLNGRLVEDDKLHAHVKNSSEIEDLLLRVNKMIDLSENSEESRNLKSHQTPPSKHEQILAKLMAHSTVLTMLNSEGRLPLDNWHSYMGKCGIASRFHPCTKFEGFTYHCCHCKGEIKIL